LFCNPVLGDAKAVHAKYFDVKVHLGGGAAIFRASEYTRLVANLLFDKSIQQYIFNIPP